MSNIFQKVAEVMKVVAYMQKDAKVGFGGNSYKAISHDKVISEVRQACIDNGIVIYPSQREKGISVPGETSRGNDKIRFEAVYDVHFVNIDAAEDRIVATVEAHAEDSGDKATGKAVSYATKYAILKTFLIETGENDESRIDQEERKQQKQQPQQPTQTPAQQAYANIAKELKACATMDALDAAWQKAQPQLKDIPQAGRDGLLGIFQSVADKVSA